MTTGICPLSNSSDVYLVEKIPVKSLITLYKKLINYDIQGEFKQDSEYICLYHCNQSDLYFFDPPITGSELLYEQLQSFDWYYMDEKNEYDYAKALIKETDSVLEIGCGKGAFSKKILSKHYIGLEFSQKAQEIASNSGFIVINESIQKHATTNPNKYDVICAFQVLEHVAEVHSFIEASVACLKPGGLLIYSVPSADSLARCIPNFALDMPPHHLTRWTDQALKNITAYFPLKLVEIWHEPLQPVHQELYAETVFKNAAFNFLRKKARNIDFSLSTKVVLKLSRLMGKIFAHGLVDDGLLPRGISVTSVYRKLAKEEL